LQKERMERGQMPSDMGLIQGTDILFLDCI
jgi:hypothetical protein